MAESRYKNQPLSIAVNIGNVLEIHNKTFSDIEDISMNLKKELATDSDNAYLEKKQSTQGVYLDEVNNRVYMHLNTQLIGSKIVPSNSDDYANLNIGIYYLCVSIKFTGITRFVELQFNKENDREIQITSDTNRA